MFIYIIIMFKGTMLSYVKKILGYIGITFGSKDAKNDASAEIEQVPAMNVTGYGAVHGTGNSTYITVNDEVDGGPIWF